MDWLAGILELLGSWLVGSKRKIGFISAFLGCAIWIYVAIITHVYGLLVVVIPAMFINVRNYIKWRKEEKIPKTEGDLKSEIRSKIKEYFLSKYKDSSCAEKVFESPLLIKDDIVDIVNEAIDEGIAEDWENTKEEWKKKGWKT